MALGSFPEIESLVKAWLGYTSVAALVRRPDGGLNIWTAMPLSAPLPAIILKRIGGSPPARSDQLLDRARISIDCWAADRAAARQIAGAVAAEAVSLSERGGFTLGAEILYVAEIAGWLWLPDPQADTPRYVIDGFFYAATAD